MEKLNFIPLYYHNNLKIVNPYGTLGLITLWSGVHYIEKLLKKAGISLDSSSSPVAVMGTLYGNGLRELLRNLLYNPQIDTLIVFGRNRSGSYEELNNFFENGVEPVSPSEEDRYAFGGGRAVLIRGTSRIIDDLVLPEMFDPPPRIFYAGEPSDKDALERVKAFIENYKDSETPGRKERVEVPLPRFEVNFYPSNPRIHTIWAEEVLTAWKDLVHTLYYFGRPVRLKKGSRRELQNIKVVIEHPYPVKDEDLTRYGFNPPYVKSYERDFLEAVFSEDTAYTYGHRMRAYFGMDQVESVVERLKKDPEDRRTYIVLWDPSRDLNSLESVPCLVSVFFRRFEEKLTMTATFRTHNGLDAWLVNVHGLMALQKYVASAVGMNPGAITVISHSISLDEMELDRALRVALEKEFRYRLDPSGYFRISLEKDAIVVEYCYDDVVLKTYRSDKAARLQHEIARDGVVSEISHAIYLGRQLERAERCLKDKMEFLQD